MAVRVDEPLPTDLLVIEVIEAEVRRLMARRAALPPTWVHRVEVAELTTAVDDLLDQWLDLTTDRSANMPATMERCRACQSEKRTFGSGVNLCPECDFARCANKACNRTVKSLAWSVCPHCGHRQ